MTDIDCEMGNIPDEDVCRDFLRNVCSRGRKCRFKHLKPQDSVNSTKEERVKFVRLLCHDFQNTLCSREECKFIHCSKEDEDLFVETGSLPTYVVEDAIAKSYTPTLPDSNPVCRDYLSGECRRGKACRFRHLSHSKYRKELDTLFGVDPQAADQSSQETNPYEYCTESKRFKAAPAMLGTMAGTMPAGCLRCPGDVSCHVVPLQGTLVSQGYCPHNDFYYGAERCGTPVTQNHFNGTCRMNHASAESQLVTISLQDENTLLKKRVMDLKKQLSDLTAANEFLLDQNAQLRMGRKNGGVTPVSMTVQPSPQQLVPVSLPATGQMLSTVTSTGQLVAAAVPVSCNATGQIMAAVSTVTVAGQNVVPTPTAQQLVPVSCTATPPQQLVPVSGTGLVPVSLATAVPVTISAVSMAPVHIPPPIVTVAQPPTNPTLNPHTPGQSLMSYPIMTQTVLQGSLPR